MSIDESTAAIKTEPQDDTCDVVLDYDEARVKKERALLYADHEVKDEMVIGPTEIQSPLPGEIYPHWEAARRAVANAGVDNELEFLRRLYSSRLVLHDAADELLCARCDQWSLTAAELHQHLTAHSTEHPRDCLQPNACTTQLNSPVLESTIEAEPEDGTGDDVFEYDEARIKSKRALLYADREFKDEMVIGPTEIRRPPPGPPKKAIRSTERDKEHQPKAKITRTITVEPKPSTSVAPNETSEVTAPKPSLTKAQIVVLDKGITDTQLQHNKTETSNDKSTCDGCGKKFSLKASLIAHIIGHDMKKNKVKRVATQDNGKQKKHSCDICDYTTDYESDLLRHLRIHSEDNSFECTLCPYKGDTKRNLNRHLKSHTEGKAHSCSFCDYKSSQKHTMDVHIRTHTGEKLYACTYCTYKCALKHNLERHIRTHTGVKPYACTYCTYKCARKQDLEKHIRTHTGEKLYACTYCTYKFARKHDLEKHIRTHKGEKPYACTYCTYKCSQKQDLEKHIRTHTGEKPYACTYCTSKFTQKNSLEKHIRTHTGEKPYSCTYCSSKFAQKNHLEKHIRTHTGEKPYACTYCNYKCARKHHLEAHIRSHTGEKPYTCTYCTYKCAHKLSLKSHIRTHTGEKPYACTYCTYKCAHKLSLRRHIRTHTGEKPYACTYCTYKCSRKGDLKKHMQTHTVDV